MIDGCLRGPITGSAQEMTRFLLGDGCLCKRLEYLASDNGNVEPCMATFFVRPRYRCIAYPCTFNQKFPVIIVCVHMCVCVCVCACVRVCVCVCVCVRGACMSDVSARGL